MENEYVQYGCGLCAPTTWRNFDASLTPRLQRIPVLGNRFTQGGNLVFPRNVERGDIVIGLPIPANSCKAIYCSHVLEHLTLTDFRSAIANTYGYLRPHGIFRFVLPDLEALAKEYLNDPSNNAASVFMERTCLGVKERSASITSVLRERLGHSKHLWMWDYKSLCNEMENAGFLCIRRAQFGDSQDPHFKDVEDLGRWEGCLGIECVK